MINRITYNNIAYGLQHFPAVALLGARQIGKSTLAKQICANTPGSIYLDMEDPSVVQKIIDIPAFLDLHIDKLVIIDEIQRLPILYSILRPAIDKKRIPGRFLILGSASPELIRGASETLAGRVHYIELNPINISEAAAFGLSQEMHWFRGGFPAALTASTETISNIWLDDFISTYIERDVSWIFGRQFSRNIMRNFWGMLAHSNGNIWNASEYSRSLGITSPTVKLYTEILEAGFLLRLLPAWYVNATKRMVKSPKVYWRDTGLLHRLSRLNTFTDLAEHPVVGGSWEGYVVEQIAQHKNRDLDMYYYRTQNGSECDIVLVKSIKPIACIEIKLSNTPTVTAGYFNCIADLKTKKNFIITPTSDTYPYYGATVCNLRHFLDEVLPVFGNIKI